MEPEKPHRGQRDYPFQYDRDNFIGVVLSAEYSLGDAKTSDYTLEHFAWVSARRSFSAQIHRLARFFRNPVIERGEIELTVVDVVSKRGKKSRKAVFALPIEISEKKEGVHEHKDQ